MVTTLRYLNHLKPPQANSTSTLIRKKDLQCSFTIGYQIFILCKKKRTFSRNDPKTMLSFSHCTLSVRETSRVHKKTVCQQGYSNRSTISQIYIQLAQFIFDFLESKQLFNSIVTPSFSAIFKFLVFM